MANSRPIHQDFQAILDFSSKEVIEIFTDLRGYILKLYPDANELLYHTHVLTTVFSVSNKLSDAYCHIPLYTNHVNLGFNKGSLLSDSQKLLQGSGKLIRHIRVTQPGEYRNQDVKTLILEAIDLSLSDLGEAPKITGKTFSKIK